MCRHLAYLGPPTPVGDLLTRGPHSLRTQSWAPREMRGGGTINADGFGVAWWTPANTATRYRNAAPIWTDPAVDEVLPQLHSPAVLAAIRSATVGMPLERAACAPFTHGRWAFSHNGSIPDWRRALTAIAAEFDSPSLLDAESLTDSAALWVILRGLLDGSVGAQTPAHKRVAAAEPPEASAWSLTIAGVTVAGSGAARRPQTTAKPASTAGVDEGSVAEPERVLRQVVRAVIGQSPKARLNLLLGDGETIWATTWHHSLSVLVGEDFVVVASEPYDEDPRWQAIGDRQLVVARPGWLSVEPLDIEIERATS